MKSIYIAGGKRSNTAINIVKGHLENLGHRVTRDAKDPDGWDITLRWGRSYAGNKPALNARVNLFDKYTCFQAFDRFNVRHPIVVSMNEQEYDFGGRVLLARKKHHTKGKDIVPCQTLEDIERIQLNGLHDFFSVFIPTQTEYRVWVFQNKALAVYEKVYKGEGEYQGYCRNRRFGFKFEKKDELRTHKAITLPTIQAVAALEMDWGAVDLLLGKDGLLYILEVNSMPHIDKPARSSGVRLAKAISNWAEGL